MQQKATEYGEIIAFLVSYEGAKGQILVDLQIAKPSLFQPRPGPRQV